MNEKQPNKALTNANAKINKIGVNSNLICYYIFAVVAYPTNIWPFKQILPQQTPSDIQI